MGMMGLLIGLINLVGFGVIGDAPTVNILVHLASFPLLSLTVVIIVCRPRPVG